MQNFTPLSAFLGGALIGLSATLLMLFNGRIAGISGILKNVFSADYSERNWRAAFIIGLVFGAVLFHVIMPDYFSFRDNYPYWLLIGGGLLVGFGAGIANGCTSGHGICGIARFSRRSLIATMTFMASAMLSVFIIRHLLGISS